MHTGSYMNVFDRAAMSINIQPIVVNYPKKIVLELIMIYIDQKMSDKHGSIMDDMEWVVNSLRDDYSRGIHFWLQIWMELDSKIKVCIYFH